MRAEDCCGGTAAHGEQPSCTCCRDRCGGKPLYCPTTLEFTSDGSEAIPRFHCSRLLGHDGAHYHGGESLDGFRLIPWTMAWGPACDHAWTSARNTVVQSGMVCPKCFTVREDQPWERGG